MRKELYKRFDYSNIELSLLPDKEIVRKAVIGELEELRDALLGKIQAGIAAELGDVLWCMESWDRIEQSIEGVGSRKENTAKHVVACLTERVARQIASSVTAPDSCNVDQRVALISDVLEQEKFEDRDVDGILKGDPRYGKGGREMIAEVADTDEGFVEWCKIWEPQIRYGPEADKDKQMAIKKLLYLFRETIAENPKAPPIIRGIEHAIHMVPDWDGKPRRVRLRPHSPKEFAAVSSAAQELLDSGLVRPSISPWACGLVLVPKPDRSLRTCCDFRQLNLVTQHDSMCIPRIDDLLDKLSGATEFSAIDMAAGYFACSLREEDREKTAFLTWSHGLLEWCRMPMGLKASGATYQRLLQQVLGPLMWESAMNYLDDVSIFSKGTDHIEDLS